MNNNFFQILQGVDETIFTKAKNNDVNSLFQLSLMALFNNRIGFAKAFLQQAANLGHELAKKYLAILNDQQQSIFLRKQQILWMHVSATKSLSPVSS